jgi:hypothetical protein
MQNAQQRSCAETPLPAYLGFHSQSPFAINEPYYGNLATEKLMTPTGRFTARTRRQRHHPALTSFKQ